MSRISGVTSDPSSNPNGDSTNDPDLEPNPDLDPNSGLNLPEQLEPVQLEPVQLELVQLEQRGPIAILTLNRPEVRNALSPALLRALEARLNTLAANPSVRAIVLTGNGIFSSGADLEHLRTLTSNSSEINSSEINKADSNRLAGTLARVYTFPKPLIAAVEGAAIAGGAGLATACDLIIAGQNAKFGYTEVRLGFVAAIVSVFLVRCIGEKHARELLLTGRLIRAPEAHRIGLINEIVPDGTSLERALEIALEIAQNSVSALKASKEALSVVPGLGLEEGLRYAATLNAWIRTTDDLKEGVAAFLERREPNWKP